jgi:hypothetical protein
VEYFLVSSPRPNTQAIVEYGSADGTALAPRRELVTGGTEDSGYGDAAMHRLSKRLWTIEIHRRLELQTRRAL